MKLHLKRTSIFKLNAARALSVLAVAALTVSAVLLSAIPVRAEAESTDTLQCQARSSGSDNTLTCNGTTVDGSVALTCQTLDTINDNDGVFALVAATCNSTVVAAGTAVSLTLAQTPLSINSNSGLITVSSGGTINFTVSNDLSSVIFTSTGTTFSLSPSPLALNLTSGEFNATASVLGIGIAQISGNGSIGSVSVTNSSPPTVTINGPHITVGASSLNLILPIAACGSSVTFNLSQFLFPIIVPATSCNAS